MDHFKRYYQDDENGIVAYAPKFIPRRGSATSDFVFVYGSRNPTSEPKECDFETLYERWSAPSLPKQQGRLKRSIFFSTQFSLQGTDLALTLKLFFAGYDR